MASGFPSELIRCRHCGAREVEVSSKLMRNALVTCCDCGQVLWTWGEFLTLIEAIAASYNGQDEPEARSDNIKNED